MRTRRLAAAEARIWSGVEEADKENFEPPPSPPPRSTRSSASSSRRSGSPASATTEAAAAAVAEEEEEEQDDPDADKSRAVGILFLAHDGVANPDLWERWRESDPVRALSPCVHPCLGRCCWYPEPVDSQ
jgi:hypothetical protein